MSSPTKPIVFTIHGIYTEGSWQDGAAAVLDPFFQYRALKYGEYRRWAVLKLAADVFLAIACSIFGVCLAYVDFLHLWWHWVIYVIVVLAAITLAHASATKFRTNVVTKLYEEMTSVSGNSYPPSIIAHSLGTYIVGRALRQFQDWSCDTIILTGCVLRRRFPWPTMHSQFTSVSNEVARTDPVPFAAALLGVSVRDMGCSGVLGFLGELSGVHNVYPNVANPNCQGARCLCNEHRALPKCSARVHNIFHQLLRHSDYFKGKNHAWKSWLPTLWGYDPVLYRLFIKACQRCALLEQGGALFSEQNQALVDLKQQCWGWTHGTLERFIEIELKSELFVRGISASPQRITALTDIIVSTLWESVSQAAAESDVRENRRNEIMEHLNPRISLKRCISATLQFT